MKSEMKDLLKGPKRIKARDFIGSRRKYPFVGSIEKVDYLVGTYLLLNYVLKFTVD